MKKIMVKNLLILSLAFGALVVIGNNVYAEGDQEEIDFIDEDKGGSDCVMSQECAAGICSILNAKKRVLANGCKKACGYTCTVQSYPWPF